CCRSTSGNPGAWSLPRWGQPTHSLCERPGDDRSALLIFPSQPLLLLYRLRHRGAREEARGRPAARALAPGPVETAVTAIDSVVPVYPSWAQLWRLPHRSAKWRGWFPFNAPGGTW